MSPAQPVATALADVVIVGAGHAGFQCADSLRRGGYQGSITLINGEADLPYQRPPLSKGHLLSPAGEEALWFRAPDWFATQNIDLRNGCRVTAIAADRHQVRLDDGSWLDYRQLVLAPGARLRRLSVAGADLRGVGYIKSLADIRGIAQRLEQAHDVVVVGGSFIALEFAATARKLGKQVSLLVRGQRLMNNAVCDAVADYMLKQHQSQGVDVRFGTRLEAIEGKGEVEAVLLNNGSRLPAQLLVAGIGVDVDIELAEAAGLTVRHQDDNNGMAGICVDGHCRTSDADIFAIGDAAVFSHPAASQPIRLESVQNAVDQAKLVASQLIALEQGASEIVDTYQAVPWFWSDQYDVKLQMAGLLGGFDQAVVRGDPATGKFSVCYFRQQQLLAIHSINKPADHVQARKLLAAGVSPTPEQAADEAFRLNSLL
jgi:3-phenylpropionate/trans-cinnamate dioxygenase ferredoxin reductase component